MKFLIDENLPPSIAEVFVQKGYEVETVIHHATLRGEPDEVIFDYAAKQRAVLVTRDLDFTNPLRFSLKHLVGLIIVRFPNEVSITALKNQMGAIVQKLSPKDFSQLIIIEPGSLRMRGL